jgi:ABC-type transport system involved in multi-copper enzyme maturation permease subunit
MELFYKELKNILLTFQFQFITIVVTVVCISLVLLGISNFKKQQEDYDTVTIKNKNNIEDINVFSELKPIISKEPNALTIISNGGDYNKFNYIQISPFDQKDNFKEGISRNLYIFESFNMDLSKTISILLSLLALLLSYKAISEEYENGTLKLLLSSSVSRWKIISAKILSYQVALTIPLTIVFIFLLIIMMLLNSVEMTGVLLGRLFIIFIYFTLYLFIFNLTGCLCSIVFRKSSISLLVSLFFWLFMIIIIPTGASFISKSLSRTNELEQATKKKINEIELDTQANLREWRKNNPRPGQAYIFGYRSFDENKHSFITRGTREEFKDWCIRYFEYRNKLCIENNKRIYEHNMQVERERDSQRELRNKISMFSLSSLLESAVENYTLTSDYDFSSFRQYVQFYRKELIDYIDSKHGFSSRKWFTDDLPSDLPLVSDIETFDIETFVNDIQIGYRIYLAANVQKDERHRKLNLKDVPVFIYKKADIIQSFDNSFSTTLVFLLLSGLLVILVFFIFNDYSLVK